MDRNRDRSINIEKMLNHFELAYKRFPAVDGQIYYSNNSYLSFYEHGLHVKLNHKPRSLSSGQVGCYLSHLLVLLEIAASKSNQPVLVLEDDVDLESSFLNMLNSSMNILPSDWDIFLCGYCCHVKRKRINSLLIEMDFYLAFHCQVVRNSSVAQRLVDMLNVEQIRWPIDNTIGDLTRKRQLKVYGLNRMIAIQRRDLYKSEIASSKGFKKEFLRNSLLNHLNSIPNNQTNVTL